MPLDDQASTSAQATETANESMYSTAEAGLNSDEGKQQRAQTICKQENCHLDAFRRRARWRRQ